MDIALKAVQCRSRRAGPPARPAHAAPVAGGPAAASGVPAAPPRRRFLPHGLLALCTLAALACDDVAEIVSLVLVTDSAGVEMIDNQIDLAGVHELTLEEELRIGSVDGPRETQLDLLGRMAVSPAGDIHLSLMRANEIRVFDAEGRHLRTMGRTGDGPGEFQRLASVFAPGDTVVGLDMGSMRVTSFSGGAGELVGSTRLPRLDAGFVTPLGPFADGWLVEVPQPYDWPEHGRFVERRRTLVAVAVRDVSEALRQVEVAAPAARPLVELVYGRMFGMEQGGVMTGQRPLWEPGIQSWAADGHGRLYVPARDEYRIDVYDAEGALVRRIRRSHRPVPVTADMKRRYLDHVVAHHDTVQVQTEFGTDPVEIQRFRAALPSPEHLPPLARLIASPEGAFLVERPDLADEPLALEWSRLGPQPSRWDLFNARGGFEGTVTLPLRFTPYTLSEGRVLGVIRDELGVEYVVRYRIR